MKYQSATRQELLEEISVLKQRIDELENPGTDLIGGEQTGGALKASEINFKDLSEHSLVGIYLIQDGTFKYASSRLVEILGYKVGEVTDKTAVKDVVFPEDWPEVEKNVRKRISGELEALRYEFRVITKSGEIRNAEVYSARTVYQEKPAIIGTYLDITKRKQTEEALRESEARWQFALENAGDGVWDWDTVSNRVFFSRQWKAMLGYAENEIGNTLDEWDCRVHPDDKDSAHADLERHFRHETPLYQSKHRVLCKDGSYKWILDRGKVVEWTEDGKPRRVIGTHADITDQNRAEEKLRHSYEQLRMLSAHIQKVRENERAEIARELHDVLGQILAVINMDLRWISKRMPAHEKELLDKVSSTLTLVKQATRAVQKVTSGLRPVVLDDFGLVAAIDHGVKEFRDQTGIAVSLTTDQTIDIDKESAIALYRIFQESLTNVMRHAKATKVEISLRKNVNNIQMIVQDNGCGISQEEMSDKRSFGILGMRERASVIGGHLSISGSKGTGTRIMAELPLKRGNRNDDQDSRR